MKEREEVFLCFEAYRKIGEDFRAFHKEEIYVGKSDYQVGVAIVYGDNNIISYRGDRECDTEISNFYTVSGNPEIFAFELPDDIEPEAHFFEGFNELG